MPWSMVTKYQWWLWRWSKEMQTYWKEGPDPSTITKLTLVVFPTGQHKIWQHCSKPSCSAFGEVIQLISVALLEPVPLFSCLHLWCLAILWPRATSAKYWLKYMRPVSPKNNCKLQLFLKQKLVHALQQDTAKIVRYKKVTGGYYFLVKLVWSKNAVHFK